VVVWGLGGGGWGLGPHPQIPNPQSPIPNPHKISLRFIFLINIKKIKHKIRNKFKK